MASVESVVAGAREYLRDHPRFFQAAVSKSDASRTFKLPHANVREMGLYVAATNGSAVVTVLAVLLTAA